MRLALGEDDSVTAAAAAAAAAAAQLQPERRRSEVNSAVDSDSSGGLGELDKESEEREEEEEEETLCAICFEHKQFISLPCACKVNYCGSCWDRALAASVSQRGRAQCPSCRGVFRVDYNPLARGLVFSPDAEGGGSGATEWRSRLYGKAKPVQIQLLRDYGKCLAASHLSTGSSAPPSVTRCPARGPAPETSLDSGSPPPPRPFSSLPQPLCVCGAHLERVNARRRVERMLQDNDSGWRLQGPEMDRLVERLVNSPLVTCDLCEEVATRTGAVWTCENGPHTVLHPAAYDVCERCFCAHVGPPAGSNVEPRLAAGGRGIGGSGRGVIGLAGGEDDTSRCASCIAAIRRAVPLLGRRSLIGAPVARGRSPSPPPSSAAASPAAPLGQGAVAAEASSSSSSSSSSGVLAPSTYDLLAAAGGIVV